MIRLIGPGGAGKSTVGHELARLLNAPFIDLDHEFMRRVGDLSLHIDERGYESYAAHNVQVYLDLVAGLGASIIALSSGFMNYPESIRPRYAAIRSEIAASLTTFVLLPSLDFETCVKETVRRQIARPFGRSSEKEEAVIRERYATYMAIPATKIESMRPIAEIAEQIQTLLPPNNGVNRSRANESLIVA